LNAAFNNYYSLTFGSTATKDVAASIVSNLGIVAGSNGLVKADVDNAVAYVTGQLNAAPATARGAVVKSVLDLWAGVSNDATLGKTYGAASNAWNTTIAVSCDLCRHRAPASPLLAQLNATVQTTLGSARVDDLTPTGNTTINGTLGASATFTAFDSIAATGLNNTLILADTDYRCSKLQQWVTLCRLERRYLVFNPFSCQQFQMLD
jgi:hypothetical protein